MALAGGCWAAIHHVDRPRFNFTTQGRATARQTPSPGSPEEDEGPGRTPENILPLPCVMAKGEAVTWGIEERVRRVAASLPEPSACPSNLLFVPDPVRVEVLEWAHASRLACHPRAR